MIKNRIAGTLRNVKIALLSMTAIFFLLVGLGFVTSAHAQEPTPLAFSA